MSYEPELTPEAEDDIRRLAELDPVLASHVVDHIYDRLCKDPVGLSRRAGFPHRPAQKYEFSSPDRHHWFTVLFRYGADEASLIVLAVGHVDYGMAWEDEPDDDGD